MKRAFLGILLTVACLGSLPQLAIAKEQVNTKNTAVVVSNVPVSTSGKILSPAPQTKALETNSKADKKAEKVSTSKRNEKKQPKATKSANDWKTKVAQQKLLLLGYSSEKPNGHLSEATETALKKFQKDNGLKHTGKLDDKTYRKLNWVAFTKEGIRKVKGTDIVKAASKHKGVPYVFGGTTPKGFDCSGYVQYVFQKKKAMLPRTADAQALQGIFVTKSQLKPGDLVFFTTYEAGASHVGIYAGNNKFWSSTSSKGVTLVSLQDSYWKSRYYGARRVLIENGEVK